MSALDEIMDAIRAKAQPSQVVASPTLVVLRKALLLAHQERWVTPFAPVRAGKMVWEISDDRCNNDILDWCSSVGAEPVYRPDLDDGQSVEEGVFLVELEERMRVEFMLRWSDKIEAERYRKDYGNFCSTPHYLVESKYSIESVMEARGVSEYTWSTEYRLDTGD